MPRIGRRAVIAGGALVAGAGVFAWLQGRLAPVTPAPWLLEQVSGPPALRSPEATGVPEEALTAALRRLFDRIGARWEMSGTTTLDAAGLTGILHLKCVEPPSYLTEYREAGRLLEELEPVLVADPAAFDQIFVLPASPGFETTRLARLQRHVIGEFFELHLAFGGFRAFGYANYRGFPGGALGDAARSPYRRYTRG